MANDPLGYLCSICNEWINYPFHKCKEKKLKKTFHLEILEKDGGKFNINYNGSFLGASVSQHPSYLAAIDYAKEILKMEHSLQWFEHKQEIFRIKDLEDALNDANEAINVKTERKITKELTTIIRYFIDGKLTSEKIVLCDGTVLNIPIKDNK